MAAEAGADGVHVGQEDLPVAVVRELVGEDLLIGLSTHSSSEIDRAGRADELGRPDYIGVGPVNATPTKAGRPAVGLELVRYAAAHASVPFFAIGGIDSCNIAEVLAAGASRVAVLRAIAQAADPERAARQLTHALNGDLPERWMAVADRDELARVALEPLGEGERPTPLWVAIVVAARLGPGSCSARRPSTTCDAMGARSLVARLAAVLLALAVEMYRRRYWAVLAFEGLLTFQILVTSLALVVASTVIAALLCLTSILLGGWLFWKLVRVMGRIQAGQRLR